ncbi:MAG: hypothetical protein HY817_00005 [Candidatus Abawacabacteria bacterium]|nr:hypothetical protein [Candidatus Abawacabacteria bacterium]
MSTKRLLSLAAVTFSLAIENSGCHATRENVAETINTPQTATNKLRSFLHQMSGPKRVALSALVRIIESRLNSRQLGTYTFLDRVETDKRILRQLAVELAHGQGGLSGNDIGKVCDIYITMLNQLELPCSPLAADGCLGEYAIARERGLHRLKIMISTY